MGRTLTARLGAALGALVLATVVSAPAMAGTATSSPSPTASATTSGTSTASDDTSTSSDDTSTASDDSSTDDPTTEPSPTSEPEPEPEPEPSPTTSPKPEPSPTRSPEPEPSPTQTSEPEPEPTVDEEPSATETRRDSTRERRSLDTNRFSPLESGGTGLVVELDEDIEGLRQLDAPSTGPLEFGANDTIEPSVLQRGWTVADVDDLEAASAATRAPARERLPLGLLATIAGLALAAASIVANIASRRAP